MVTWLEITADYQCNNRCLGCFSVRDEGAPPEAQAPPGPASMATAEILEHLAWGRRSGARALWLGGGEPTLRRDLVPVVAAARRMGYQRVKLQTNGMLLAYGDFTRRLASVGVTEVNFSLKGATAESHDRLTRTPGCFDRLCEGIAEARAAGLALEGDVLLYRHNLGELPELVRGFFARGLARFSLWLLSAAADAALAAEVPRIGDVVAAMEAVRALALSDEPGFLTSLHTPPCTLPPPLREHAFFAPDLGLVVTNPGGHRFPLEQSPIEGGLYLPRCQGCSLRARCGGARADYVAVWGDDELQPVSAPPPAVPR